VAVGRAAELVQQGVGDLQRDHPEDLGMGDGEWWPLGQEPVVQQLDADLVDAAAAPGPAGHLLIQECRVIWCCGPRRRSGGCHCGGGVTAPAASAAPTWLRTKPARLARSAAVAIQRILGRRFARR
jgi:hypothetical protein